MLLLRVCVIPWTLKQGLNCSNISIELYSNIDYCYTFINLAPPKYSSCLRREVLTKRDTYVAFPSLMRKPWIILQFSNIYKHIGGSIPNFELYILSWAAKLFSMKLVTDYYLLYYRLLTFKSEFIIRNAV